MKRKMMFGLALLLSMMMLGLQTAQVEALITVKTAKLPTRRYWTSAIWDGSNAYIFGGDDVNPAILNQIVQYNPATDTVTVMTETLPTPSFRTSAIWDGSNAYIFGGRNTVDLDDIVKYDPATGTAIKVATLPSARCWTSAVWDGSNAYIFGGFDGVLGYFNEIVRYDPPTPPPVGGTIMSVNKLKLLAPLIGLASIISITIAVAATVASHSKTRKRTPSHALSTRV